MATPGPKPRPPRPPPRSPPPPEPPPIPEGRGWDEERTRIAVLAAGYGLGDDEIATLCAVPRTALGAQVIRPAIERARAATGQAVAAALLAKALRGNVGAQIFWLRARHLWREADGAEIDATKPKAAPRILVIE